MITITGICSLTNASNESRRVVLVLPTACTALHLPGALPDRCSSGIRIWKLTTCLGVWQAKARRIHLPLPLFVVKMLTNYLDSERISLGGPHAKLGPIWPYGQSLGRCCNVSLEGPRLCASALYKFVTNSLSP